MEQLLNPFVAYKIGLSVAVVVAVFWSFVLDKQKPATIAEFLGKFAARTLFLIFMFAIVMGFLYLALGLSQNG